MEAIERYRGSLLGLAVGDALGTTLEFKRPGSFSPIDDIVGGGPFGLKPGEWTDDTSMALCLAESLIGCFGFEPSDQLDLYVRWRRDGHLSSNGRCFDVGVTVGSALNRYERTGEPYCGSTEPYSAGNGSIMRLAPVPLFFAREPRRAVARAADSSRTTHGTAEAVNACRYLAALIVGAVHGGVEGGAPVRPLRPGAGVVGQGAARPPDRRDRRRLVPASRAPRDPRHRLRRRVARGRPLGLRSRPSFREGAILAVNLGDDADTTGAVYGQLAGAFYGESGIPRMARTHRDGRSHRIHGRATLLFRAHVPSSSPGDNLEKSDFSS